MADNEKLDNQRLKNFKNKGRDLEVNSGALAAGGGRGPRPVPAGTASVGSRAGAAAGPRGNGVGAAGR